MAPQLSPDTIDSLIVQAHQNIRAKVESGEIPLSSEATFRFCFTWELGRILGFAPEFKFDFERELYTSLHSSDKFLDLLVWTDPNFKVALEFKLPKGSIIIQPSEGDPE